MSNVLGTLFMAVLLLVGVAVIAQSALSALGNLSDAWKQMEARSSEISRTEFASVSTSHNPPNVDVTVSNTGKLPLHSFADWDVVAEYYETDGTYHQVWLPYTTAAVPGENQWTVTGVYLDAGASIPEVFQPGILDPGEEMVIRVNMTPAADTAVTNQVIIGTPNGISLSIPFASP